MLLHKGPQLAIYFGDAKDQLYPQDYQNLTETNETILAREPFSPLKKLVGSDRLVFLKQVHGVEGTVGDALIQADPFSVEGDYLITEHSGIGIGVMTADCLPIMLYDIAHQVAAIIHAGWRGSVQKIACIALEEMQRRYNTHLDQLQVFFGPSAKICCYQVNQSFIRNLEQFTFFERTIRHSDGELFFDLPALNRILLESMGVKPQAFRMNYNFCTICDESFFSYRRQSTLAGRQMTVLCLR